MAEPVVVEFRLSDDEAAGLLHKGGQFAGAKRNVALLGVLTVLAFVFGGMFHNKGLVNFGIILAAVTIVGVVLVVRTPKLNQQVAARMAGTTRVTLSDEGVEYAGATVAERIAWSRVQRLTDRPEMWTILTKVPVTSYHIPKSAIPLEQREQFASQLIAWSGDSFKFRKR